MDTLTTIFSHNLWANLRKTILFTQVINHATEHRAQIMAILTQFGIEPPELDAWTYFDEMN